MIQEFEYHGRYQGFQCIQGFSNWIASQLIHIRAMLNRNCLLQVNQGYKVHGQLAQGDNLVLVLPQVYCQCFCQGLEVASPGQQSYGSHL